MLTLSQGKSDWPKLAIESSNIIFLKSNGNYHEECQDRGVIAFACSAAMTLLDEPYLKIISYGITAIEKIKKILMSILTCRKYIVNPGPISFSKSVSSLASTPNAS